MNGITNKGLLFFGIFISIGLILTGSIGAYTYYQSKRLGNVVTVTGSAQENITSDIIKWKTSFSRTVTPDNVKQGYIEMQSDYKIVGKYLVDNGIPKNETVIGQVNLVPVYNYYNGGQTLTNYTLVQRIEVQSSDIEKINEVGKRAGVELANLGVIFSDDAEEYYYSKFADLKVEMLTEATKNAKDRAEKIAESTGAQIGDLQSASMGVFQVTAVNSTDLSDYGTYDTAAIEKQVTAVVKTSFNLK